MPGEDRRVGPSSGFMAAGADLLNQLHVAMIRLDTKFDGVSDQIRQIKKDLEERLSDHEKRIRDIEARPSTNDLSRQIQELTNSSKDYVSTATMWKMFGAVVGIASLAVTIIGMVMK